MIDLNFVKLMENTEKEAKRFFERNPSLATGQKLIERASFVGMLDREDIDADLFKHLMKKYTAMGYENKPADDPDPADAMFQQHQQMKEAHRRIYGD